MLVAGTKTAIYVRTRLVSRGRRYILTRKLQLAVSTETREICYNVYMYLLVVVTRVILSCVDKQLYCLPESICRLCVAVCVHTCKCTVVLLTVPNTYRQVRFNIICAFRNIGCMYILFKANICSTGLMLSVRTCCSQCSTDR